MTPPPGEQEEQSCMRPGGKEIKHDLVKASRTNSTWPPGGHKGLGSVQGRQVTKCLRNKQKEEYLNYMKKNYPYLLVYFLHLDSRCNVLINHHNVS